MTRATVATRFVDRIGVAIGASHLRAAGLRSGRVMWALETERAEKEELATALERFLRALPLYRLPPFGRWPRPAVRVVLGARHAQVKRLVGLPPGLDGRQLARLVQEGAPRFFLRNGHPLVTTGISVAAAEAKWSAALDAEVVETVCRVCREAGLRLACIGPTVAALPLALEGSATANSDDEELRWELDGELLVLRVAGGRLTRVTRTDAAPAGAARESLSRPRVFLAALADRAPRFADAYGAALLPADAPLFHRPQRSVHTDSYVPRWRTAAAAAALLLAGAAALVARPLAAVRAERQAAGRLSQLGAARAEAARMQRDLVDVSAALAEVERFAATRRSPTLLLADLARALPRGSALVTARMDTSGIVATLLAPRVAPVLGTIEKLPRVVAPQIVGPVTREVAIVGRGGTAPAGSERVTLERMSIRFRLAAPEQVPPDSGKTGQ